LALQRFFFMVGSCNGLLFMQVQHNLDQFNHLVVSSLVGVVG
jgi:hypothetical protein